MRRRVASRSRVRRARGCQRPLGLVTGSCRGPARMQANAVALGVAEERHVTVLLVALLGHQDLTAGGFDAIEHRVEIVATVEVDDRALAAGPDATTLEKPAAAARLVGREP